MPAIFENIIAPARGLLQHSGKLGMDRDRHPLAGLFLHHGNATVSDIGPFHRHHVADALARVEQEVQSEMQLLVRRGEECVNDLGEPRLVRMTIVLSMHGTHVASRIDAKLDLEELGSVIPQDAERISRTRR